MKFSPTLIIFGTKITKKTYFSPHIIYVNALTCETQMRQIVTFCSDYLYPIAHIYVIY